MTEVLTIAQMRAIERAAIDSGKVSGLELMERAGQGVVAALLAEWPELADGAPHAVVLCGPGNNGGDGFVVARALHDRGWRVEVLLLGAASALPPDARINHDRWLALGAVQGLSSAAAAAGQRPALVVDALFGIGLSRPLSADLVAAMQAVSARAPGGQCRLVAVDCPSGLDLDSGQFLAPPAPAAQAGSEAWNRWRAAAAVFHVAADLTVTFHRPKIGHHDGSACGALRVVDIGLGAAVDADPGALAPDRIRWIAPDAPPDSPAGRRWLRLGWQGDAAGHKYERGHVLVLAGGSGQGGAARLAARAALRIGAGLVTIACPPEALAENAARLDAIMLRPLSDASELSEILGDGRISSLCLGPGLGVARARALVPVALAAGRRVVLDADALSAYRDDPETLFALCRASTVPGAVIMTPHEGEFARLFPDLSQSERSRTRLSRIAAARIAARRSGATVLLKGAVTVIARPDGVASLHAASGTRSAPQLATAGAGDVLAGFIAGLIAPHHASEPYHCVELATWLHVECARSFGPGLIAEDLPEQVPQVLRAFGL